MLTASSRQNPSSFLRDKPLISTTANYRHRVCGKVHQFQGGSETCPATTRYLFLVGFPISHAKVADRAIKKTPIFHSSSLKSSSIQLGQPSSFINRPLRVLTRNFSILPMFLKIEPLLAAESRSWL